MFRTQAPCLAQRKISKDEIVFCTFKQGTRMYGTCADADQYAEYILLSNCPFRNELLWSHTHTFFDLDSAQHLQDLGHTDEASFVEQFNAILIAAFQEHLGVAIPANDILWSNSTREGKLSYHITVVSNQFYWPVTSRKTDLKNFAKLLDSTLRNTPGFHYYVQEGEQLQQVSILDTAIYSPNRCFRSLGCAKPAFPEARFLPLRGEISHSQIVKHMITVSDLEGRQPYRLKTQPQRVCSPCVHTNLLQTLASQYGSEYVSTQGSLVILRNSGPRQCPIGGETNQTDNAFMVLKDSAIFFGCHNSSCTDLLKIHSFPQNKKFVYYEDYLKLLKDPEPTLPKVHDYMKSIISYVDKPSEPFFCTYSKLALPCWDHRLVLRKVNLAKNLFRGYGDIHLAAEDEPIKFSNVLAGLLRQREIPTYNDHVWLPHLKEKAPKLPSSSINTFTGFALEQVPHSDDVVRKTPPISPVLRES